QSVYVGNISTITHSVQKKLQQWNQTGKSYANKSKCVHHLFEATVAKSPDAIAVVIEDKQITYQVLNQCANQLANYLTSLRVGPEALVPIVVERSFEMFVALLGILKAGGTYVPLDPVYPEGRLQFILSEMNSSVLIIQSHLQNK